MTKNEKICKATCDGITSHNLALIKRVDADDFDIAKELDCTSNGAQYKITDFFDAMKRFEYGHVPTHLTDQMVATTDQLLDKIAKRYDCKHLVQPLGLAFRRSKRVWRIKNPIATLKPEQYHDFLDRCRDDILAAIEKFVCELSTKCECEKKPKRPKTDHGKGKQTPFMKMQLEIFKDFLDSAPATRSSTAHANAGSNTRPNGTRRRRKRSATLATKHSLAWDSTGLSRLSHCTENFLALYLQGFFAVWTG